MCAFAEKAACATQLHATQGADTVIYERLAVGHPTNEALRDVTLQHMEDYGTAGLRTLCLAYKELHTAFYDE